MKTTEPFPAVDSTKPVSVLESTDRTGLAFTLPPRSFAPATAVLPTAPRPAPVMVGLARRRLRDLLGLAAVRADWLAVPPSRLKPLHALVFGAEMLERLCDAECVRFALHG